MYQESVLKNMKKLNNISVCRISLFILFSLFFDNKYIYILLCLLLLIYSVKESFIYLLLISLILLCNSITIDFIPYGIVERKVNNYFVVDKILYKTEIYSDDINIADIIYTKDGIYYDSIDKLKKNIKFKNNTFNVIYNLKIKNYIYNRIQNFNDKERIGLNKFLYNINNYDDISFNLGYGLSAYYLIKEISKRNKAVGIVFLLTYIVLFYFDPKFYILIIDFILKDNKYYKYWLKLLLIALINNCLFYNYSIIIPLLLSLRNRIDLNIDFKGFLVLIESMIFGYVNLISIIIFKYLIYIQIFLLCFSIILLLFPCFASFYRLLLSIYSSINESSIELRGSITVLGFIIYFLCLYLFKINNENIKIILILFIILSPFNNPFLKISFIDVGQGDSELIRLPFYKGNILIDTGSKYNYFKLKNYLYSESIYKIDYLIITHDDSDHNGNIDSLKNDFKIKNIITIGEDIYLNDLKLKYLYIDDFDNDNDNSLVYWSSINDISFLFTGDISSIAERKLIDKYVQLDVDILKASHHGSNSGNSEYFIANTNPSISIISTSGKYGHPSSETINTFNSFLVDYYITKDVGNVEFYLTRLINILKTQNGDFAIIR